MQPIEWIDLLPIVQSALNNAPSPQRRMVAPVQAFTGLKPSPPISTFLRTETSTSVTINELQLERALNIDELQIRVAELHQIVENAVRTQRAQSRNSVSKGTLPNFSTGDFVLVSRDDFTAGEKLSLRWRGPRRIVKAINYYVYQVQELRNDELNEIHISRLKFYHDPDLDTEVLKSHIIQSETGMVVQRLRQLVDSDEGLKVEVRWKGLPESEDTMQPIENIYEDTPDLLKKLLDRKNTPPNLAHKARELLHL